MAACVYVVNIYQKPGIVHLSLGSTCYVKPQTESWACFSALGPLDRVLEKGGVTTRQRRLAECLSASRQAEPRATRRQLKF